MKNLNATEIAARLTADEREHYIVVLGGDGTVNEVSKSFKRADSRFCPMMLMLNVDVSAP